MSDAPLAHPNLDQLTAFDRGLLAEDEWETVERHVASCADCGPKLDGLPADVLATMVRAFSGSGLSATEADLGIPSEFVGHARYRVLRALGAGGMGVVFQAIHRLMDRVVALKVVHRALLDRPGAVERFRQEIRAAAQLSHPHIVTAYDADQAGDLHFLVMEYVEGTTLDRQVAREGPPDPTRACDWVRQAALGLQHACERGMVHRDIKPANLLLTPNGWIKILDLGLARFAREGTTAADTPPYAAVSPLPQGREESVRGDEMLGTPDYMAPEQARDPRRADIRSDVYGLGCTLYYLLTGRPPFAGGTDLQKLIGHQERLPAPLMDVRPSVPPGLAAVLGRMLAKDPSNRYQTPAEVARDLAPLTGGLPTIETEFAPAPLAKAASRGRFLRRSVLLAGAAVLAAAGLLGIALWPPTADPSRRGSEREEIARQSDPRPGELDLLSAEELVHREKEARDRAVAWVRDNNRWGPEQSIVAKVAAQIDEAHENTEGFHLELGAKLVKSGKTTVLAARAGELAVFELTPAQLAEAPFHPAAVGFHAVRHLGDQWRRAPTFILSDLVINGADALDVGRNITGSVAYRGRGPIPHGLCLRLSYFPGEHRRSAFDNLDHQRVAAGGSLSFSFGSVSFSAPQYKGPLVVFLELCSFQDTATPPIRIVESNTLTAMIFVKREKRTE